MADINLGVGGANSAVAGGYTIDNSLKLEADNTEYLSQTIGAGSRTTATYSFWFKRTELGANMQIAGISPIGSETTRFLIDSNDRIDVESGVGGDNNSLVTNRVFRDTSAWYHFVVAIDTTQATAANRVKVYVNGVQETSFLASEYPAQNTNLTIGVSGYTWRYGAYDNTYNKSSGYLAEAYYIDAQQLDPTSFGEFDEDTGIWKPIAYTGSFGSNGHYLDFSDAGDLGNNSSGVGNDFTLNNITSADQATDTPTNNFCIPQITQYYNSTDTILFTEGGTKLTTGSGTGWRTMHPTMSLANGKWYFEVEAPATNPTSSGIMIAITPTKRWTESAYANFYAGQASGDGIGWYLDSTRFRYDDGTGITPPTNTLNAGDIIGIALDMDNNFVYSSINGSWLQNQSSVTGVPTSGVSGTGAETVSDEPHMIGISMYSPSKTININYGGYTTISIASAASDANGYGNFEYAPPSGYYAICSKNLAEFG
jgi:hypothetical protein